MLNNIMQAQIEPLSDMIADNVINHPEWDHDQHDHALLAAGFEPTLVVLAARAIGEAMFMRENSAGESRSETSSS